MTMWPLAKVWFVTPIFGMSLSMQASPLPAEIAVASVSPSVLLRFADVDGGELEQGELTAEEDEALYAEQMRERADLIGVHRPLGIATWVSMTATAILGLIQYYNLYGVFAGQGSNPCVKGDAVFGQSQCRGTPWPHAVGAIATTGLYSATFIVSLMMPDPDNAAEGESEYARTLRTHKALRWVHFGGMIAQGILGPIIANGESFGLDRANDYGTLQALSTVHLAIGLVTLGALTWAALLML